jgi:hypothetical protein
MKTCTSTRVRRIVGATALISLIAASSAAAADDAPPPATPPTTDQKAMTVPEALAAMRGMGGDFRISPEGDYFLYPYSPADEVSAHRPGLSGMQGMEAMHGMDAMGGVPGYFQILRSGEVYFYPYPGEPVGMSGMRGRPAAQ